MKPFHSPVPALSSAFALGGLCSLENFTVQPCAGPWAFCPRAEVKGTERKSHSAWFSVQLFSLGLEWPFPLHQHHCHLSWSPPLGPSLWPIFQGRASPISLAIMDLLSAPCTGTHYNSHPSRRVGLLSSWDPSTLLRGVGVGCCPLGTPSTLESGPLGHPIKVCSQSKHFACLL